VTDLLNVDQALERVLAQFSALPGEEVDLFSALGRVLAEPIHADTDIPPFANSSMDGFAVIAADITDATKDRPVTLKLVMDIPAGSVPARRLNPGEAARIMTGAPLPEGADAVVPVEDTDNQWTPGKDDSLPPAVTVYRGVERGGYVRLPGEDMRAGQVVLTEGTILRPPEIGVLASLGKGRVPVVRQPRVAIVSTGDELIGIDEPLQPGKIRDSNSYGLAALVASYGGTPIPIPVARDTLEDVRRRFREALDAKPDIILSSAGVSVGAFDVVRTVIDELGEVNFWKINLRPGKPLAFGQVGGVPFFGLPGNPVSAMVTFDVFVRPALLRLGRRPDPAQVIHAAVAEEIRSDGRRSYLRVKLVRENGQFVARTTGTQSSGVLLSMVLADGLLIVPEDRTHVAAGEYLPVRVLRDEVLTMIEESDDKR
jgi:molybdopterin molybdotransferase